MKAAHARWLIAERCDAVVYSGWHVYLRDSVELGQRNADGSWGWLRRGHHLLSFVHALLGTLGILMRPGSDGSCDGDGYEALARRFPLGDARGGVAVVMTTDELALVADES
jgi:hypothetical protein